MSKLLPALFLASFINGSSVAKSSTSKYVRVPLTVRLPLTIKLPPILASELT